MLAVGIAERVGDARRGGGNCGEAGILEDASAGHIPRVRKNEHVRPAMKLAELDCLIGAGFHGFIVL